MTLEQVIKFFGSRKEAAYRIGYHEQTFRYWEEKKQIPQRAQLVIEAKTNGILKAKVG